jgi:hypothetical protein
MKTRWILIAAWALAESGCSEGVGSGAARGEGVGAVCLPARPPSTGPSDACGADGGGCFLGNEVYLSENALECATHTCMVSNWDEHSAPQEQTERAYCTCRCFGDGDPASYCACPEGFVCEQLFPNGPTADRYCIRSTAAGP